MAVTIKLNYTMLVIRPKMNDSVDGIKRKKCIQINNFFCMIQKPVRKNKEYQKN